MANAIHINKRLLTNVMFCLNCCCVLFLLFYFHHFVMFFLSIYDIMRVFFSSLYNKNLTEHCTIYIYLRRLNKIMAECITSAWHAKAINWRDVIYYRNMKPDWFLFPKTPNLIFFSTWNEDNEKIQEIQIDEIKIKKTMSNSLYVLCFYFSTFFLSFL